jgi:DNA-binding MarR family transcriptional regulator
MNGERAVPMADPVAADPAGRLQVALSRVTRMLRREAPTGLGHSSVSALATIGKYGPLRSGDLAVREGVSAPTMTRVVAGLESAGYVTRDPDPADGRASLIRITHDGGQLLDGNRSKRLAVMRARIEALPTDQRAALLAALPALDALAGEE